MQYRSKLVRSSILLCLLFATVAINRVYGQSILPQYTITKIDTLGGYKGYSYGYGISPDGQVTGKATTPTGSMHAFRYTNGVMKDLGALNTDGIWNSEGRSINAKGQVAGYAGSRDNKSVEHAVLYSDDYGYLRDLGSLANFQSFAFGINASGHITGQTSVQDRHVTTIHAFVYRNGTMTDIGTLCCKDYPGNGLSVGYAINDSGQITGSSHVTSSAGYPGNYHAFLHSNGVMTDLGTLGGSNSSGLGINASGQITGKSHLAGDGAEHAFLYSGGTMTDLGTLPGHVTSEGRGINASGDVVGIATDVAGTTRPFLYRNGAMTDLNDLLPAGSGWTLIEANGINDAGQIVGTGRYAPDDWLPRAFVLNPMTSPVTGSIVLSATSLVLVEGGATGSYTMVLANAPSADVVVSVSSTAQLSTSPIQMTFTPANWNVPQNITVSALQDGIAEGAHSGRISHAVASVDPRYQGITVGNVGVTINDALVPVITISVSGIWTQPDLPVSGSASPGATVILNVLNTTAGTVSAVSGVVGADGKWNVVLTGLMDGTYELQAEASGIKSSKVTVVVDSRAPVSTLSVSSNHGPNANGWYTGPVDLAITAVDDTNGQGVARSEYTLDGGVWTVFSSVGLTLTQDGNHTVCYRSVDKANNTETTRCMPVLVDATAPQVNSIFDAAANTLNLNAEDPVSGIASVEVSLDGGLSWMTQTGPLGFTKDGTNTVEYRVRDYAGNLGSGQTTVTVATKPSIISAADQTAIEGAIQSFNLGSFADFAGDGPWRVDVNWGDGSASGTFMQATVGTLGTQPHGYADNGLYTVTVSITDQAGNADSKMFRIGVNNVAPSAGGITVTTTPVNINTALSVSTSFSDPGVVDTHTAIISWGDGTSSVGSVTEANGAGTVTGSHSYAVTGSYTVMVTVTDKDDGAASVTYQSIVVVDLAGARVNGNGRIDSPAGALPANPGAAGNVNLQVRANYNGGSTVPTGSTSFDFNGGNLDFQSSAYEWLIVSGNKALLKGMGTINGAGNYGFLVSVIDNGKGKGSPDAFRIKIWDAASGVVVYDSQLGMADDADPTTLLSGGKITIK